MGPDEIWRPGRMPESNRNTIKENLDGQGPVYQALNLFFHSYLTERDAKKALTMVTEDIFSLGTGDGEAACGRAEFKALLEQEIAGLPDPIFYRIMNYKEKKSGEEVWDCFCNVETFIRLDEEKVVIYSTRLTASFVRKNGTYLASVLHMSEASALQEENEFFPLRFASEDMKKLDRASQQELIEIICQVMPGGIIGGYQDEGWPLYLVNETLLEWLGYTYEEFIKDTGGMIANMIHPEDMKEVSAVVNKEFESGKQYEVEYRARKKDGTYLWVYDTGRKIYTSDGREAIISVLIDVSENVRIKKNLLEESMRDPLTGLYNRRGGERYIDQCLKKGKPYAFIMLDIDNFKALNDRYGHHAGDTVLRYIAERMKCTFRDSDIIVRLGGDEFVIFVESCYKVEPVLKRLEEVSRCYREKMASEYPLSKSSLSFGGVYGNLSSAFHDLYCAADKALYEVKRYQKGSYRLKPIEASADGQD